MHNKQALNFSKITLKILTCIAALILSACIFTAKDLVIDVPTTQEQSE